MLIDHDVFYGYIEVNPVLRGLSVFIFLASVLCHSQSDDDKLIANGFATYSELGSGLYVAALFLESPSTELVAIRSAERKRMEIKILADRLSYRKMARILVSKSAINNRSSALTENAKAMEQLLSWFKDHLYRGDHIVLNRTEKGFILAINSVELAEIESPMLFNMLLNTWIGDVPPDRNFKARILGLEDSLELASLYGGLSYAPERVAVIESWKADVESQTVISAVVASETETEPESESESARPEEVATGTPTPQVTSVIAQTSSLSKGSPELPSEPEDKQKDSVNPQELAQPVSTTALNTRVVSEPQELEEPGRDDEFSAENLLLAQLYSRKLLVRSRKNIGYPTISRRLGHTGTVVASVTINRDGKLVDLILTEQSKYSQLNSAVKKGIRLAAPFPDVPEQIQGDSYTFSVPVTFRFNK